MSHFGQNQYYRPQDGTGVLHSHSAQPVVYQYQVQTGNTVQPDMAPSPSGPVYQAPGYSVPVQGQWWQHHGQVIAGQALAWPSGSPGGGMYISAPPGASPSGVQPQPQQQQQQQQQPAAAGVAPPPLYHVQAPSGHQQVYAVPAAASATYVIEGHQGGVSRSSHTSSGSVVSGPVFADMPATSPIHRGSASSFSGSSSAGVARKTKSPGPDGTEAKRRRPDLDPIGPCPPSLKDPVVAERSTPDMSSASVRKPRRPPPAPVSPVKVLPVKTARRGGNSAVHSPIRSSTSSRSPIRSNASSSSAFHTSMSRHSPIRSNASNSGPIYTSTSSRSPNRGGGTNAKSRMPVATGNARRLRHTQDAPIEAPPPLAPIREVFSSSSRSSSACKLSEKSASESDLKSTRNPRPSPRLSSPPRPRPPSTKEQVHESDLDKSDDEEASDEERVSASNSGSEYSDSGSGCVDPRGGYGLAFNPTKGKRDSSRSNASRSSTRSVSVVSSSDENDSSDEESASESSSSSSSVESDSNSSASDSADSDSDSDDSSADTSDSDGEGEEEEEEEEEEEAVDQEEGGCQTSSEESAASEAALTSPRRPLSTTAVSPASQRAGRRRQVDEAAVKVPLKHGWKRDTRLRPKFHGAMRGDVFYFSPCGKKLRTYPEVQRYLDSNGVKNLNISNFSFSTKLMVGDFHEKVPGERELVKLSPDEVMSRQLIEDRRWKPKPKLRAPAGVTATAAPTSSRAAVSVSSVKKAVAAGGRRGRRKAPEPRGPRKKLTALRRKQAKAAEKARLKEDARRNKLEEKQRKRELKVQERALRIQRAEELKQRRRMESDRQRLEENRRRQQERELKRDEQRREREVKRMQVMQEKELKRRDAMMRRQEEARFKAEEREKRRVDSMIRREQEARKKAEEREKLRLQRLEEKIKKQDERRRQDELERMLRQPGEDLLVSGGSELPPLCRLVTPLPSKEFGSILTAVQFLQEFSPMLELDFPDNRVPDVPNLVKCVMSMDRVDDFLRLVEQLLSRLLAEEATSSQFVDPILSESLSAIDLGSGRLTEVLRLYLHSIRDLPRAQCMDEALVLLERFPLSALSPVWKTRVLEFLVNELCSTGFVAQHIEEQLDLAADLRRDKMKVECRLRKLRMIHKKVFARQRRPRRTADFSQFPGVTVPDSFTASNTSSSAAAGAVAGSSQDSSGSHADLPIGSGGGGSGGNAGGSGTAESKSAGGVKYEEDEEYDDEEEEEDSDDEDEDGSSSEHEGDDSTGGDEDNEEIEIRQFEGEPVIPNKESADEQIAFCVKWQSRLRNRLNAAMRQVRTTRCGHDRYFRGYMILPGQSDLYVEGLDHDPLSTTITTRPCNPPPVPASSALNSTNSTPMSHTALQAARTTKRSSFLEMELERLEETRKLWAAQDACEADDAIPMADRGASGGVDGSATHAHPVAELRRQLDTPSSDSQSSTPQPANPLTSVAPANHGPVSGSTAGVVVSASSGFRPLYRTSEEQALAEGASLVQSATAVPAAVHGAAYNDLMKSESPTKSEAASVTNDGEVPEYLRDTVDILSLEADTIHGWFHLETATEMKGLLEALHPRGEREQVLCHALHRHIETLGEAKATAAKEKSSALADLAMDMGDTAEENVDACQKALQDMAKCLKEIAVRISDANLQSAGTTIQKEKIYNLMSSEGDLIQEARQHLLDLEALIERRYVKPPLRENDATAALEMWRECVSKVTSASQLQVHMWQLSQCLAWEKSIMKVYCQGCRKGDNEDLLLLCDECENGYHTYCCSPKLSSVPEGDWFCAACTLMANRSNDCEVCSGSNTGHLVCCESCNNVYHLVCLSPSMSKLPRLPWTCGGCKKNQVKSRRQEEDLTRQARKKDMNVCRTAIAELEKHQDAWPFLAPVSRKRFPDYYRVIDTPMDFSTIRQRLKDNKFLSRNDFASCVRLVFDNCQTYNEDESDVGCASHEMRQFFEKRWKELCSASPVTSN